MKASTRFDLVDLRLFLFVVEAASITHGAARGGMALASASERIRLMEESLGAPLLERHRRSVRATPAGTALVHHAQLVIQQLERMGARAPVRQYDCNPYPFHSRQAASAVFQTARADLRVLLGVLPVRCCHSLEFG